MPKKIAVIGILILLIAVILGLFLYVTQKNRRTVVENIQTISASATGTENIIEKQLLPFLGIFMPEDKKIATTTDIHIPIPKEVKAIYVTAPMALTPSRMNKLLELTETTEINSMVINVKDGDSIYLTPKMAEVVKKVKEKNIYPIARVVVFQDNGLANERPDLALKTQTGKIWAEKNYNWVDPASKEVWEHNLNVSLKALDLGFEEINFDYFRFPSGGVLDDIIYPHYDGITPKQDIINSFAEYLTTRIRQEKPEAITSLDIFGYTFLKTDDLGIGQNLNSLANYFDVIAPMVYPSHYSAGNFGFKNPAKAPYEVILQTLIKGKELLGQNSESKKNFIIRPWIQDFNMGAIYDAEMVNKEKQAIKDAGLDNGWMSWNPSNLYEKDKYIPKEALPISN